MSTVREIAKYTGLVAVLTLLLKPLGIVKEMVVASTFGVSQEMDVYFLMISIPVFFGTIMYSVIRQSATPLYLKLQREKKPNEAMQLITTLGVVYFSAIVFLFLLITVFKSLVIKMFAPGFSNELLETAGNMATLAFSIVLAIGLSNFFTTFLEAEKKFFITRIMQALVPVCMLIAVLCFSDFGVVSLLLGMMVGYLLSGLLQAMIFVKEYWGCGLSIDFKSDQVRHALRLWVPFGVGSLVSSSSYVIDRMMISLLGEGDIAIFGYANVLVANLINILLISFSSVLLPVLSSFPSDQKERLAKVVGDSLCLSMFILLPVAGLIAIYSGPLIELIYQRGMFTEEDHASVSALLSVYIFSIVPLTSVMLFSRALNALMDAKTKVIAAFISASLNVCLNYALMQQLGIIGIALSTVLTHLIVTGYFLFMLRVKHNFILPISVLERLIKVIVFSCVGMIFL